MQRHSFDDVVAPLQELRAILQDEDAALQHLDFAGIDAATRAKEDLADRLQQSGELSGEDLSASERSTLLQLRAEIGGLARRNHARLRATLDSVQGLVGAMTGSSRSTYGPNAQPSVGQSQAILTTDLG